MTTTKFCTVTETAAATTTHAIVIPVTKLPRRGVGGHAEVMRTTVFVLGSMDRMIISSWSGHDSGGPVAMQRRALDIVVTAVVHTGSTRHTTIPPTMRGTINGRWRYIRTYRAAILTVYRCRNRRGRVDVRRWMHRCFLGGDDGGSVDIGGINLMNGVCSHW